MLEYLTYTKNDEVFIVSALLLITSFVYFYLRDKFKDEYFLEREDPFSYRSGFLYSKFPRGTLRLFVLIFLTRGYVKEYAVDRVRELAILQSLNVTVLSGCMLYFISVAVF